MQCLMAFTCGITTLASVTFIFAMTSNGHPRVSVRYFIIFSSFGTSKDAGVTGRL